MTGPAPASGRKSGIPLNTAASMAHTRMSMACCWRHYPFSMLLTSPPLCCPLLLLSSRGSSQPGRRERRGFHTLIRLPSAPASGARYDNELRFAKIGCTMRLALWLLMSEEIRTLTAFYVAGRGMRTTSATSAAHDVANGSPKEATVLPRQWIVVRKDLANTWPTGSVRLPVLLP